MMTKNKLKGSLNPHKYFTEHLIDVKMEPPRKCHKNKKNSEPLIWCLKNNTDFTYNNPHKFYKEISTGSKHQHSRKLKDAEQKTERSRAGANRVWAPGHRTRQKKELQSVARNTGRAAGELEQQTNSRALGDEEIHAQLDPGERYK
jgi:hypothetical protein